MVGGSAFYLWSFINGLSEAPPANLGVRAQLLQQIEVKGIEKLYDQLKTFDQLVPLVDHRLINIGSLELWKYTS